MWYRDDWKLVHLHNLDAYYLDESISSFRGYWSTFSLLFYSLYSHRNSCEQTVFIQAFFGILLGLHVYLT